MSKNLINEWKRLKSCEYKNLFSNIIFFEKVLKYEYSRFIDNNTPYGRLQSFFRNFNKFRKKRIKRMWKLSAFYTSVNGNIGNRKSLSYDLGYVYGEWSEGYDWINLHDLKIYDLVNVFINI